MGAAASWDHHREGSVLVMMIKGEIDLSNSDQVEKSIRRARATADLDDVVVDLSGVSFIDSSGLRAVYQGTGNGVAARLRNPSPLVERLLDIAMPGCFVIETVDPESPARTLVEPGEPAVEPNEPA